MSALCTEDFVFDSDFIPHKIYKERAMFYACVAEDPNPRSSPDKGTRLSIEPIKILPFGM